MKLKQKHLVAILVFLLCLSLVANVMQARETFQAPVRGTFSHTESVETQTFLIFSPRPIGANAGLFFMHRGFEVLAEGHYAYLGDGIYELRNREGALIKQLLHQGDYVYIFHQNNEIIRFYHVDNVGLFTGARPDEEFWHD